MESAPESVGGEPPIEASEPLPAELSGLMPPFVLGGRSGDAGPAPARGALVPAALAVAAIDVAVPTRVHVASAEAPSSDVVAEAVPHEVNVIAPVVVDVDVADAVVPAPAAAAVPSPGTMPAPVRAEAEAEGEAGEGVDPEGAVERCPAAAPRRRI